MLKAEILPNDRKYYGTRIRLTNTETGSIAEFDVWINGISDDDPSEREYDYKDENDRYMIHDHEEGSTFDYEFDICDNHYETAATYKVCQKIVEAIDGMEI